MIKTELNFIFSNFADKILTETRISIYSMIECNFKFGTVFLIDGEIDNGIRKLYYITEIKFELITMKTESERFKEGAFFIHINDKQNKCKEIQNIFPDSLPLQANTYAITVPKFIEDFFFDNPNYSSYVCSPIFFKNKDMIFVQNNNNNLSNLSFLKSTIPANVFIYYLKDNLILFRWANIDEINEITISTCDCITSITTCLNEKFVLLSTDSINSTISSWNNEKYSTKNDFIEFLKALVSLDDEARNEFLYNLKTISHLK